MILAIGLVLLGPATAAACVTSWGYHGGAPAGYPKSSDPAGHPLGNTRSPAVNGRPSTGGNGISSSHPASGNAPFTPTSAQQRSRPRSVSAGSSRQQAPTTAPTVSDRSPTYDPVVSTAPRSPVEPAAIPVPTHSDVVSAAPVRVHPKPVVRRAYVSARRGFQARSLATALHGFSSRSIVPPVTPVTTAHRSSFDFPGSSLLLLILGLTLLVSLSAVASRWGGARASQAHGARDDEIENELQQIILDARAREPVAEHAAKSGCELL